MNILEFYDLLIVKVDNQMNIQKQIILPSETVQGLVLSTSL